MLGRQPALGINEPRRSAHRIGGSRRWMLHDPELFVDW